ncbi:response regulator [Erwinia sp. CPCC 100877]|nr:response regulator [Erwinia sp. CPCC 100877]
MRPYRRMQLGTYDIICHYNREIASFLLVFIFLIIIITIRKRSISYDIETRRNEEYKAMQDANSKTQFIAKASHELRTPINAMMGLLEIEIIRQNDKNTNLRLAWESGKHLLSLASKIIDLNKIETGFYQVNPHEMSLKAHILNIINLYQENANKKNLSIIYNFEISNNDIIFDAGILNQIISNLLSNAIKFTISGTITITVFQDNYVPTNTKARFGIEVSDTGPGIREEDQKIIFNPFVQLNSSHSTLDVKEHSSGLGLSICKELIDLVGGTITVDSTPGIGTTFTIFFEADIARNELKKRQVPSDISHNKDFRVLVVDDHIANVTLLTQQLSMLGFSVESASSGKEAFSLWYSSDKKFDVILTDCYMSGGDGLKLTEKIREYERRNKLEQCMIIGLTASSHDIYSSCIAAGMDDCLFKPLDLDEIALSLKRSFFNIYTSEKTELNLSKETTIKFLNEIIGHNRHDVALLKAALHENKFDLAYYHAHSLKGSATITNETSLVLYCKSIEENLAQGTHIHLEPTLENIEAEVLRIEDDIKRRIKEISSTDNR